MMDYINPYFSYLLCQSFHFALIRNVDYVCIRKSPRIYLLSKECIAWPLALYEIIYYNRQDKNIHSIVSRRGRDSVADDATIWDWLFRRCFIY